MTESMSSVALTFVNPVSENSRMIVPELAPFTLIELRSRMGELELPSNGLVTPVVVLTIKSPTPPLKTTTPESELISPAPLSVTVKMLAPCVSRRDGTAFAVAVRKIPAIATNAIIAVFLTSNILLIHSKGRTLPTIIVHALRHLSQPPLTYSVVMSRTLQYVCQNRKLLNFNAVIACALARVTKL